MGLVPQGVRIPEQQSRRGPREPPLHGAEAQKDGVAEAGPGPQLWVSRYFSHFKESQMPISKDIFASP